MYCRDSFNIFNVKSWVKLWFQDKTFTTLMNENTTIYWLTVNTGAWPGSCVSEQTGEDLRQRQLRRCPQSEARVHPYPTEPWGRQRGSRGRFGQVLTFTTLIQYKLLQHSFSTNSFRHTSDSFHEKCNPSSTHCDTPACLCTFFILKWQTMTLVLTRSSQNLIKKILVS